MLAPVGMVGDVARNVGGECVEVSVMMAPGTDPHLYQPTASDVGRLQSAELILYVGYGLEGQLGEVLGSLAGRVPTLAVAEAAAAPDALIAEEEAAAGVDPHLWMDASLWAQIVPAIGDAIIALRPDCAEAGEENAAAYAESLAALHDWVVETIATIPQDVRTLVTAHDAFEYYGAAYGLEVEAIQGISTETEASIGDIREAADVVVERGVPAVFIETTLNPRTIQAMVEAAEARGHEVEIGGELYSDAMGEEGTADGTYIGMIRANTLTIAEALGGTAPPLPSALAGWADEWDVAD
ncbi:zinc ABC transporter substrate-binding protein [soil metagenome]